MAQAIRSTSDLTKHGEIVLNPDGTNIGSSLPTGAATSDNQTNGNQQTKIKETAPTDTTKVNASLTISNLDMVVASTQIITMTIGLNSYNKTISYNAIGDVISVSSWVAV